METYVCEPLQIMKQDQQWLTEEETAEEIPSTESVDKVYHGCDKLWFIL